MEIVTGLVLSTIPDDTPQPVPPEWTEYQLCKALHCLPQDLDDMDQERYRLWVEFMRIEQKSGRL